MTSTGSLLPAAVPGLPAPPRTPPTAQVEIVIPVRNEEGDLAASVRRLVAFVGDEFPFTAQVTIADNGSTDGTWGVRREVISRGYNLLLHAALGTRFSDAQCGFKAIRAEAALMLLPLTTDAGWFFDTELLVLAERAGLRIHEVPVDWIDDPDTRVKIIPTAVADLRGIVRLGSGLARGTIAVPVLRGPVPPGLPPGDPRGRGRLAGQLTRFVVVGAVSTVAYVLLYLLLRGVLGAQAANAVSLLATAVANTAVNRRLTFGIRGRAHAARHQARGLIAFGIGLALTSGALAALHAITAHPARAAEVTVLVAANLVATVVRFTLYRSWVFRGRGTEASGPAQPGAEGRPALPQLATVAHVTPIHPNGSPQ